MDGPGVVSSAHGVSSEGVTQRVRGDPFLNSGIGNGFSHGFLNTGGYCVPTALLHDSRGWEQVLPPQLAGRFWIFVGEAAWEVGKTRTLLGIAFVKRGAPADLALERWHERIGKECESVLVAFSRPHADGAVFEINVLDAELTAFFDTEPRTIHDSGHQAGLPLKSGENPGEFFAGGNRFEGLAFRRARRKIQLPQVGFENVIENEFDGAEGLLTGYAPVALLGKGVHPLLDGGSCPLRGGGLCVGPAFSEPERICSDGAPPKAAPGGGDVKTRD